MYSIKKLHEYSSLLNVLYVEDDNTLREDIFCLLSPLFKSVDLAVDGEDGLDKYNDTVYDLIITDINMPKMNGIEMIKNIREINPEQKIISITAHNEENILISIIKAGVNSFILKPIVKDDLVNTLYPVCRDAHTQNMNIELVEALNDEKELLKQQNIELRMKSNTIAIKQQQLETIFIEDEYIKLKSVEKVTTDPTTEEYFQKDEDEGYENITLLPDHCAELADMYVEIPELISYNDSISYEDIQTIAKYLTKSSSIFMHYTPYVDTIADSLNNLSQTISNDPERFKEIQNNNQDALLMYFDAVCSDMERYIERFSVESLAMKNSHHIHRPTALSIEQIVGLINPAEVDYGEMELF